MDAAHGEDMDVRASIALGPDRVIDGHDVAPKLWSHGEVLGVSVAAHAVQKLLFGLAPVVLHADTRLSRVVEKLG